MGKGGKKSGIKKRAHVRLCETVRCVCTKELRNVIRFSCMLERVKRPRLTDRQDLGKGDCASAGTGYLSAKRSFSFSCLSLSAGRAMTSHALHQCSLVCHMAASEVSHSRCERDLVSLPCEVEVLIRTSPSGTVAGTVADSERCFRDLVIFRMQEAWQRTRPPKGSGPKGFENRKLSVEFLNRASIFRVPTCIDDHRWACPSRGGIRKSGVERRRCLVDNLCVCARVLRALAACKYWKWYT